jgi:5-methylthioadenosine/S-adenosylhomocysteine deaminase
LLDFPAPDNKTWDQAIGYAQKFILRWKGDPLITPALAPHALYTVNRTHLEAVRDLAKQLDVPILTHLAEARSETQYAHQNFGLTPTGYLDQVGLLSARTLLAHVIHVDQQDLALLNQRDVGIVHCPQSNMKLASGTAPVPAMLKNGMRVGLGTDGAASNNDLNLWEEIDTAAKLHKLITGDPTVVTAEEALALATIGGARALHLEDRLGSLEPGKLADLIVVGMSAPHQSPVYNLYSHLVYATKAGDVSDVMVNGRWLMRDRRLLTLKEPAVMNDVRRYQRQIRRGLNDVLNAPTGR